MEMRGETSQKQQEQLQTYSLCSHGNPRYVERTSCDVSGCPTCSDGGTHRRMIYTCNEPGCSPSATTSDTHEPPNVRIISSSSPSVATRDTDVRIAKSSRRCARCASYKAQLSQVQTQNEELKKKVKALSDFIISAIVQKREKEERLVQCQCDVCDEINAQEDRGVPDDLDEEDE